MGGIYKRNAILVGKHQVSLLKLDDGATTAMPKAIDLGNAMPSGRGFMSGKHYFLPTTEKEVVRIDLDEQKIRRTGHSRGATSFPAI